MSDYVNLEKWRGKRDAVELDPAKVEFRAVFRAGASCRGCLFERQWSATCTKVLAEAAKRGLESCNHGVIYILVEKDPRQLDIEDTDAAISAAKP